jgi:N-methylhydantoinase A/oxoprolinase/acetone carboxylase beta subunit
MARMFIVGVDVGGTFTDVTAVDEATTRRRHQGAIRAAQRGGGALAGLKALGTS